MLYEPTIEGVRKCIIDAYREAQEKGVLEGTKSGEAYIELQYKSFWECETEEDINEPYCLMVYSYFFGPSRQHYFFKAQDYKERNYCNWEGPNIFQLAIDKITEWKNEFYADLEEDDDY